VGAVAEDQGTTGRVLQATAYAFMLKGDGLSEIVVTVHDGPDELRVRVPRLSPGIAQAIDRSPKGIDVVMPGLHRWQGHVVSLWYANAIDWP
jgi:hypothetical protein